MSLKIAVEAVVAGMKEEMSLQDEEEETFFYSQAVRRMLKGFITQLEIALAAAGDAPIPNPFTVHTDMASAAYSHRAMIEKAKAEFAGKIKPIEGTADVGHDPGGQLFHDNQERMFFVVGGPAAGEDEKVGATAPLPSNAPVGCHTIIAGAVYTLQEDNRLHYNEELSRRYVLSRVKPEGTVVPEKKALVITEEA